MCYDPAGIYIGVASPNLPTLLETVKAGQGSQSEPRKSSEVTVCDLTRRLGFVVPVMVGIDGVYVTLLTH